MSPVLCSARLKGGSLCLQKSQGKAVLLLLQGGEDKAGALSWQGVGPQDTSSCHGGGATATQAPCSSSRREMRGQICPACIPGSTSLISPFLARFSGYPYPPMQTLSPGLPRNPLDTNPTTATTMVCQSPVLTLFSPALKVTAEERD